MGSIGDGVITWFVCDDYVMGIWWWWSWIRSGRVINESTMKAEIVVGIVVSQMLMLEMIDVYNIVDFALVIAMVC